jgi:hypothetical protein
MSHHPFNRKCRDIITANIPWCPDEHDSHIRAGDWIGNPTPNSGNPLDWVYLVLELTHDKASVIEFKKITPNGNIQATALLGFHDLHGELPLGQSALLGEAMSNPQSRRGSAGTR